MKRKVSTKHFAKLKAFDEALRVVEASTKHWASTRHSQVRVGYLKDGGHQFLVTRELVQSRVVLKDSSS